MVDHWVSSRLIIAVFSRDIFSIFRPYFSLWNIANQAKSNFANYPCLFSKGLTLGTCNKLKAAALHDGVLYNPRPDAASENNDTSNNNDKSVLIAQIG